MVTDGRGGVVTLVDEQALLDLWQKARTLAAGWCRIALARLRAGQGGFYDDQDLWQDLFLEFWAVVGLWQEGEAHDEEHLWDLWKRALRRGGLRVLKRAPQRLWVGVEEAVEPCVLALDGAEGARDVERTPLPLAARRALTLEDSREEGSGRVEVAELAEALWRLRPLQRQTLYLGAVVGLTADQVARCLGLTGPNVASQRLHRARERLQQCLAEERSAAWTELSRR
ncbi:MAG: RNA polymerase sigma factor [Anaerolineae bacterium]